VDEEEEGGGQGARGESEDGNSTEREKMNKVETRSKELCLLQQDGGVDGVGMGVWRRLASSPVPFVIV